MAFGLRLKSDPKILKLLNRVNWKTYLFSSAFIISLHARVVEFSPLELRIPSCSTKEESFYYPVRAIDYVREHNLTGNMLCAFGWGEYILWNLYPKCLVGMDGRYEAVYPANISRAYFDFDYGRDGWRRFLDSYPHDMILIKSKGKIHDLLQSEKNWKRIYRDDGCALFVRQDYRLIQ